MTETASRADLTVTITTRTAHVARVRAVRLLPLDEEFYVLVGLLTETRRRAREASRMHSSYRSRTLRRSRRA